MNGFYSIYFTGLAGSGFGLIALKDGGIVGVDVTGGSFDGVYKIVGSEAEIVLAISLLPGAMSITGHPAGPDGLRMEIPLRVPVDLAGGHTLALSTPYGPINANVRKLRDFA